MLVSYWLCAHEVMAANYSYQSTPEEDQAIRVKADEDGVSPQEAFSRIVGSALGQILDNLKRNNEQRMMNDARACTDRGGIFQVDTRKGDAQWQCIEH
jgi:DNA-directed RNA polymerase subunit L